MRRALQPVAPANLLVDAEAYACLDGYRAKTGSPQATESIGIRLMHWRAVSRIYERFWRPSLMRLVSNLDEQAEDQILGEYLAPKRGLRILDLCCGTARIGRRYAQRGADVLGVDVSESMLREARRLFGGESLVLVHGDAADQIAVPGSYDAAVCFAALHLVPQPEKVLAAAVESLKIGGLLFAWVLASRDRMARFPCRVLAPRMGVTPWPEGELEIRMDAYGCDVESRQVFGSVDLVVGRRGVKR